MFEIKIILYFIFAHWVSDFVLQSDEDAKKKSSNFLNLVHHTGIYSVAMIFFSVLLYRNNVSLVSYILFFIIMLLSHTFIDFFTSKLNKRLYNKNKTHLFFTSIGFDQFLHYIILLYSILLIFI